MIKTHKHGVPEPNPMKCSKCGEYKPLSEFLLRKSLGYHKRACKQCEYKRAKIRRMKRNNKEQDTGPILGYGEKRRFHIGDNEYPTIQICTRCGKEKSISEYKLEAGRNYHKRVCTKCARATGRENRNNNLKKYREYSKKHRKENKEYYKEYKKEWKKKNENYQKEYSKIYRKKNKDSIRLKQKGVSTKKYREDENYRIKTLLGCRIRSVLKRNGIRKSVKTIQLLGCEINEFKNHIERQFQSGMNWDAFNNGEIHLDHIRPCASFDLTDLEQQKECFCYINIQPLWAIDNIRKGAKYG